jgi:sulfur-carrier protein adenylyltransferase/sulfurtransferase
MIWWAFQPSRAQNERVAIADLEERSPWLSNVQWRLEKLDLRCSFGINYGQEVFALELRYPAFFPNSPALVIPTDGRQISGHQYGDGGELCLEFRSDNWEPSITGAMLIESAYRLISGERRDEQITQPLPSAHQSHLGRDLRQRNLRFVVSPSLQRHIKALLPNSPIEFDVLEHYHADTWITWVSAIGDPDAPQWAEPPLLRDGIKGRGTAVRLAAGVNIESLELNAFSALLRAAGCEDAVAKVHDGTETYSLLIATDTSYQFLQATGQGDKRGLIKFASIELPESETRLPDEYVSLADKKIGIVGCGSVGSKIAISLGRAGLRKFVLVDPDILLPGNLARNELDFRAIGVHKVDAVAARLRDILSDTEIVLRRIELGGQEAAAATSGVMAALSLCDLIIDATADPNVFNLCAAVSRLEKKSFVWCEVLAGGVGGIIARARPELDPPPQAARRQIAAWCDAQGVPWSGSSKRAYDVDGIDDGAPLIADDADVTVVAAHAARLCFDTLLRTTGSIFPQSAYAIGLSKQWIFGAPFDTCPIDLSLETGWGPEIEEEVGDKLARLLADLLPTDAAPDEN